MNYPFASLHLSTFALYHLIFIAAIRNSRRSGGSLPHTRRTFAHPVALLRPAAAQTDTKFSTRRRSTGFPPHILAHLGGSFAHSANFNAACNI
jgi:hypothetical protein